MKLYLTIAAVVGFAGVYAANNLARQPTVVEVVELSEQEAKSQARAMLYEPLAREPIKYLGTVVVLQGKVIQVVQNGDNIMLRVNVTQQKYGWDDTVWVDYRRKFREEPRILENDIVHFWGKFVGVMSYKTVLGQTLQIPHVAARIVENAGPQKSGSM